MGRYMYWPLAMNPSSKREDFTQRVRAKRAPCRAPLCTEPIFWLWSCSNTSGSTSCCPCCRWELRGLC